MSNRRDALKVLGGSTLGLASASVLARATTDSLTTTSTSAVPDAFSIDLTIRPLPFEAGALEGLSEKLIQSHWENNYAGSVRALNEIKKRLTTAMTDDALPAFVYNDLKREHLMRTGSVILHELYFGNLFPDVSRVAEFDKALSAAFGSPEAWEKEFRRIGAGLGGGSGWVMLAWNHHLGTLENYWLADHTNSPSHATPILLMDMYEHAYHMDYGTAASKYIDAFMANVNWAIVAQRLDQARRS